jgi:hypothetical protein
MTIEHPMFPPPRSPEQLAQKAQVERRACHQPVEAASAVRHALQWCLHRAAPRRRGGRGMGSGRRRRALATAGERRAWRSQASVKRVVMGRSDHPRLPYKLRPESDVRPLLIVEMLNSRRLLAFYCDELLAVHKFVGEQPA